MTLEDIYIDPPCGSCPCVKYYLELELEAPANDPDCVIRVGNDCGCDGVMPDLIGIGNTTFNADVGFNDTSFSQIVLSNDCGQYDRPLCECFWRGRPATLYVGLEDWDCADYVSAFCGSIQNNPAASQDNINIAIVGTPSELLTPVQQNLYPNSDPIPLTFGCVFNMQPYIVNAGTLVFQVHDGAIQDVLAVYDNGAPLAFDGYVTNIDAALVNPGAFVADLNTGLIKLGAPFDGPITADVKGPGTDTASIIQLILERLGLDDNIDTASLAAFSSGFPYDVGISLSDQTAQDAINSLVQGSYGWWGISRSCQYEFGLYRTDPSACDYTVEECDIESINKLENLEPYSSVRVNYRRNWTPLTSPAAITQSNGSYDFFTNEYQGELGFTNFDVIGAYGPSVLDVRTYLSDRIEASSLALDLRDTLSGRRECIQVSLMCGALQYERGKTICVNSDRYCASDKPWYISSVVENVQTMQATLTLCRTCDVKSPCFLEASVEFCECEVEEVPAEESQEICICFDLYAIAAPPILVNLSGLTLGGSLDAGGFDSYEFRIDGSLRSSMTFSPASTNFNDVQSGITQILPDTTERFELCVQVTPEAGQGFIEFSGEIVVSADSSCEDIVIPVNHRCDFEAVGNLAPVPPQNDVIDDCLVGDALNYTSDPFSDPEGDTVTITFSALPSGVTGADNGDNTASLTGTSPSGGPHVITITGTDSGGKSSDFTVTIDCQLAGTTGSINGQCNQFGQPPLVDLFCGVGSVVGGTTSEQICSYTIANLVTHSTNGTPQTITLTLVGATSQNDFESITIGGVTLNSASASYSNGQWVWGYPSGVSLAGFNTIQSELSGSFTVDYVC